MQKRLIDMSSYPRKSHFDYFRSLANPYVGVTADTDVTELVSFCRKNGYSFYLSFLHAAALAANAVPEFRQRIEGDGIAEYAACGTSHTESREDGTYCYCTLWHDLPFEDYIRYAEKERAACRKTAGLTEDADPDPLYFISTLPWIHYRELIQPTAGGDESNPRITWGAYEENWKGRLMMPVTVLCNHALMDGSHLARFYRELDRVLQEICSPSRT